MTETLTETFRSKVEDYLGASGLSASAFGWNSCGNPSFVFKLREGRSPRLDTVDKVSAWMRDNPPGAS